MLRYSAQKSVLKQKVLENAIKKTTTQTNFYITSWSALQNFLMELHQVYEKPISSIWELIFFIYLKKANVFVERIYQLRNFDINLKDFHLGCLFL